MENIVHHTTKYCNAGMSRDLDNASGSAGALRDQMKQMAKDLGEYKTMMSSANKKLRERQKEVQV